jgi:hypothetical protein
MCIRDSVRQAGDAVMRSAANGTPAGDAASEWNGMPEYESQDKTAHRSIIVHFRCDEDVAEFVKRLDLGDLSPLAKFTWFPYMERNDFASQAYVTPDD